jgi:hypothetical protein
VIGCACAGVCVGVRVRSSDGHKEEGDDGRTATTKERVTDRRIE